MKRVFLLARLCTMLLLVFWVTQSIAQTLASDLPAEQKLWEVMLKALFPPIWTALSPLLTGLISTGMTRLGGSLSPTLRYVTSTIIGTVTGALAGTVDAFPLTSESAANMGGTAGLTGQWLAERNPAMFGGTAPQAAAATAAKTVPVILLACLMTGCISLSAKVCTPESVTAIMPNSWPSSLKKACPVDFSYSNITPEAQQTLRVIVPAGQMETSEVKPINQLKPIATYPEYDSIQGAHDNMTLPYVMPHPDNNQVMPIPDTTGLYQSSTAECKNCLVITPGHGDTFLLGPGMTHDGH